jgi:hypothetical protein
MAQGVLFILACAFLFGLAAFLFRDQMCSCGFRQSSNLIPTAPGFDSHLGFPNQ